MLVSFFQIYINYHRNKRLTNTCKLLQDEFHSKSRTFKKKIVRDSRLYCCFRITYHGKPSGHICTLRYNVPNIALDPKSGEDGKFNFSYFFIKVDYMTFTTSMVSFKSAKWIPRYDLSKWYISENQIGSP